MPLIGYIYEDGVIVCADCDLFPPNSTTIHVGDPEEGKDCMACHRPLSEVEPAGGVWDD